MFIKFGDKTKKIIVKNSKNDNDNDNDNVVYLDNADDDRRAHILKEYEKQEEDEKNYTKS